MFDFFHGIVGKIVLAISSIALFFSGATASPSLVPQDATSSAQVQIITTAPEAPKATTTRKAETNAKQDTPKENKDSLIDTLKKQVADLTQKANQLSQPKVEVPKTSVITLPSGAAVEMDANGNVIRTIKEAPHPAYTDICNNIEGAQSYTPSGMTRDTGGNCVVFPAPTPASIPASTPTTVPAVMEASASSLTFTVSGAMVNGREEFGVEVEDGGIVYKQYGVPIVLAWTVQARGVDAFFHCSIGDDGGSIGVASQGTRNAVIGTNIIKCIGFGFDKSSTPTGTILKKSVQVKVQ